MKNNLKIAIVVLIVIGAIPTGAFAFVKGKAADVSKIKYALSEIQNGTYATSGTAVNISSFYLPYPDPEQKIVTTALAVFNGEIASQNAFFHVQTKSYENDTSAFDLTIFNTKKYVKLISSSLIDAEIANPNFPGIQNFYKNILNTYKFVPENYVGAGKFAIGQLAEGWGIAKNLTHVPSLLSPDGDMFINNKVSLFKVSSVKTIEVNKKPALIYTLKLLRANVVPFAVELREKIGGRALTYVEKDLVKDDYGKIQGGTIVLVTEKVTGKPVSLTIDITSKDVTDKIYRDLNYSFHLEQRFESIIAPTKIVNPKTTEAIFPEILTKIAN